MKSGSQYSQHVSRLKSMQWNSSLYDQSHDFVSRYGERLLQYLNPQKGERILDLGCGTGDLSEKIYESGAEVVGIDNSATMIDAAKKKYPGILFFQQDARHMNQEGLFDAVFSNAVLHWIPEKEKVIAQVHRLLKPGGRLVVEFGGKGNNQQMLNALRETFRKYGYEKNAGIDFWYYPSIGEYASELEKFNFRVVLAEHYDRSTPLKGENGIIDWFRMFGEYFFQGVSETEKEKILNETQDKLRPTHFVNGEWYADYKRIRVIALR